MRGICGRTSSRMPRGVRNSSPISFSGRLAFHSFRVDSCDGEMEFGVNKICNAEKHRISLFSVLEGGGALGRSAFPSQPSKTALFFSSKLRIRRDIENELAICLRQYAFQSPQLRIHPSPPTHCTSAHPSGRRERSHWFSSFTFCQRGLEIWQ